jgi:hypothetical protein
MKYIKVFILFLFGMNVQAQLDGSDFNKLSLEAGYGMSKPFSPVSITSDANFISYSHLNGGIRYMYNENIGVKGQLAYERYSENSNLGIESTHADIQLHYNIGRLLNIPYSTYERVGLFVHSGVGISMAKSININRRDRVGNLLFGITPKIKISNSLAVFTDLTYSYNRKQDLYYDGSVVKRTNGSNAFLSVGLIVYLGSEDIHADWY